MLALARALSSRVAEKRLVYNWRHRLPDPLRGTSLASLSVGGDLLLPPWPDIVIAPGRRSVPVVRWIRRRHPGVFLVQIGRPQAGPWHFDLVLTTPQYGLPAAPNLVRLPLPVVPVPESQPPPAAMAVLPPPRLVILAGGNSWPWHLDARAAWRLRAAAERWLATHGGSVLPATSRRTPAAVGEVLFRSWPCPCLPVPFGAAGAPAYSGLLAHADAFMVTMDSASMLADAAATPAPVMIFRPPARPDPWRVADAWLWRFSPWRELVARGWFPRPRRLDVLAQGLVDSGRACLLPEQAPPGPCRPVRTLPLARQAVLAALAARPDPAIRA